MYPNGFAGRSGYISPYEDVWEVGITYTDGGWVKEFRAESGMTAWERARYYLVTDLVWLADDYVGSEANDVMWQANRLANEVSPGTSQSFVVLGVTYFLRRKMR